MVSNILKGLLVALIVAMFIFPLSADATEVNDLYKRFVGLLMKSDYRELERLVKDNRDMAGNLLRVVKERLKKETDPKRSDAYRVMARELEELLVLSSGRRDCDEGEKVYRRALNIVVPEESFEVLSRAVRLCPTHVEANLRLGEAAGRLGKFDQAVSAYESVLAIKKDQPDALLGLGETLYAAGLYQRALPYFEEILTREPGLMKAQKYLASASREVKKDRDGIIPADELIDRLWKPLEGELMCMCPYHVRLRARVRLREVTFPSESVRLDSSAKRQLHELAKALKTETLRHGHFLIEGHADPTGPEKYNRWLSLARAAAVRNYLVDGEGVEPSILSVAGLGYSRPWTGYDTTSGLRANRRIEIISIDRPSDSAAHAVGISSLGHSMRCQ
jgi:outer membrane protein OmpA-like peptidoglycan-associated protein